MPSCPLCKMENASSFFQDKERDYFRCGRCHLVFVPPRFFLSPDEEKARYDLHQNSPEDAEYRRFLSRLFKPLTSRLAPGSRGLDFGSGPGPTLSVMFREIGHTVNIYDYFYAKDASVLNERYDFITATEVLEHLREPENELNRLWDGLKPGGSLGIMTKLVRDAEAFSRWHYKDDPTHVCFFSRPTLEWIAVQWRANICFVAKDAILFHKQD